MRPKKFERFVKVMMLTSSPVEGEALAATRMANNLLAEVDLNWDEFLNNLTQTPSKPKPRKNSVKHTDAEEINKMFEAVVAGLDPDTSFSGFIESLHSWWEKHGFLTEKQYTALKNSYDGVW